MYKYHEYPLYRVFILISPWQLVYNSISIPQGSKTIITTIQYPKPFHNMCSDLQSNIRAYVFGFIAQSGQSGPSTSASDLSESFWHNVKHGIYYSKVGSALASSSLQRADGLAIHALRKGLQYDLSFLQDLLLTLSPVNVRVQPSIRQHFLGLFYSQLLMDSASQNHPLTNIIMGLKNDMNNAEVSETAANFLLRCINTYASSYPQISELPSRALKLECAVITLLRRDKQLQKAADKANALLVREETKYTQFNPQSRNPEVLKPMRFAACELFFIRMDQGDAYLAEAVQLGIQVMTGIRWTASKGPSWPPSATMLDRSLLVPDGKSLHALECMAKICEGQRDYKQAVQWLTLAQVLAVSIGSEKDIIEHIREKMAKFQASIG